MLSIAFMLLVCAPPAMAASFRLYLADQSDFAGKQGYYVDFENDAPDQSPCSLSTLRLNFGVADGAGWRYLQHAGPFDYNKEYRLVASVAGSRQSLSVDGEMSQSSMMRLAPAACNLKLNLQPDWGNAIAQYRIVIDHVNIQSGSATFDRDLSVSANRSPALLRLEPYSPVVIASSPELSSSKVNVNAVFHLVAQASDADITPLIDRYGQVIDSHYTGKIASNADLDLEAAGEISRLDQIGTPAGFDRYGGRTDLGWTSSATGFYRVEKHSGAWWMITPDGTPCFYTSVSAAPSVDWDGTPITGREQLYAGLPERNGPFAAAWKDNMWGESQATSYFSFRAANLIRKFTGDWGAKETSLTARRLRTFGYAGVAKWGGADGLPSVQVLHLTAPKLTRHCDIFDPDIDKQIVKSIADQIVGKVNDPNIVGWSIGNETEEIIWPDEISDILGRNQSVPAKRALVDHALSSLYSGNISQLATSWQISAKTTDDIYANQNAQPPATDIEALRRFFADRYYAFLYNSVKGIDPHHLYFGFWIVPGWWADPSDWATAAAHVDVIGYDRYSDQFADDPFAKLLASIDMPAYCGEFSYPPDFDGTHGFGRFSTFVHTEDEAGLAYERWIHDAAKSRQIVGCGWFEYHDEPITGRGPGNGPSLIHGENYAFGLYTEQDQPRWTLLEHMRKANVGAAVLKNASEATGTK